jgi:hypothetical protein
MFGAAAPGGVLMRVRRLLALIAPVGVLIGALFFDARASVARPGRPYSFQLTEAGKYYRDHRSLDGYQPTPKTQGR